MLVYNSVGTRNSFDYLILILQQTLRQLRLEERQQKQEKQDSLTLHQRQVRFFLTMLQKK